jgi:hypothetical protein
MNTYTKEEARRLLCPPHQPHNQYCRASICMHWRWTSPNSLQKADSSLDEQPAKGYCGLSGKP